MENTESIVQLIPSKSVIEHDLEAELSGKVVDGEIKLDTTDIDELSARLRVVRIKLRALKKEDDRVRQLILAHPSAKVGFGNRAIEISANETVDITPELLSALADSKKINEAVNISFSVPKIRKLAETNATIAEAFGAARLVGRKIKTK